MTAQLPSGLYQVDVSGTQVTAHIGGGVDRGDDDRVADGLLRDVDVRGEVDTGRPAAPEMPGGDVTVGASQLQRFDREWRDVMGGGRLAQVAEQRPPPYEVKPDPSDLI